MIYQNPNPDEPIDQSDLIDGCPVAAVVGGDPARPDQAQVQLDVQRGLVLTQTCDLAHDKAEFAVVAVAFDAQFLGDQKLFKPA